MRSARSRFLFLLSVMTCLIPAAFAADDAPWTDRFFGELEGMKSRMTVLEEQQKEILAKEDTILEKLDQLRIWVHRK